MAAETAEKSAVPRKKNLDLSSMCQSISWSGWGCDSSYVLELELMLFKVSIPKGSRVREIKVDIMGTEKNEIWKM